MRIKRLERVRTAPQALSSTTSGCSQWMIFHDPLLQTNISKQPFRPSLLRAHGKSSRRFNVTEHDPPLPRESFQQAAGAKSGFDMTRLRSKVWRSPSRRGDQAAYAHSTQARTAE